MNPSTSFSFMLAASALVLSLLLASGCGQTSRRSCGEEAWDRGYECYEIINNQQIALCKRPGLAIYDSLSSNGSNGPTERLVIVPSGGSLYIDLYSYDGPIATGRYTLDSGPVGHEFFPTLADNAPGGADNEVLWCELNLEKRQGSLITGTLEYAYTEATDPANPGVRVFQLIFNHVEFDQR